MPGGGIKDSCQLGAVCFSVRRHVCKEICFVDQWQSKQSACCDSVCPVLFLLLLTLGELDVGELLEVVEVVVVVVFLLLLLLLSLFLRLLVMLLLPLPLLLLLLLVLLDAGTTNY